MSLQLPLLWLLQFQSCYRECPEMKRKAGPRRTVLSAEQERVLAFATTPRKRTYPWDAASPPSPAEIAAYEKLISPYPNIFLTGEAGTGKSTLIKAIVEKAKEQGRTVAITASTGVAAVNCGGMTIHSFMGCGAPRIWKNFHNATGAHVVPINACDLLIIDEISGISGECLLGMDRMAAFIRSLYSTPKKMKPYVEDRAFGGMQLIFVGDFFQLGPIMKGLALQKAPYRIARGLIESLPANTKIQDPINHQTYAFQSPAWERAQLHTFVLRKLHRQSDKAFATILHQLRHGRLEDSSIYTLMERAVPLKTKKHLVPICLETTNAAVDTINRDRLAGIKGPVYTSTAIDSVSVDATVPRNKVYQAEERLRAAGPSSFWKSCHARSTIRFKVGANVMLLSNLDVAHPIYPLCNGSRGWITEWVPVDKMFSKKREWVRSGHLKRAHADDIIRKAMTLKSGVPVVRFENGRECPIFPVEFTSTIFRTGSCVRYQLPLRLSYAITINKSQGLTLNYCNVNLSRCFNDRLAYVAISRVRSLEQMHLEGMNFEKIKVPRLVEKHWAEINYPEVARILLMWYRRLKATNPLHPLALCGPHVFNRILFLAAPDFLVKRPPLSNQVRSSWTPQTKQPPRLSKRRKIAK